MFKKKWFVGIGLLFGLGVVTLGANNFDNFWQEKVFKNRFYFDGTRGYEKPLKDISTITLGANGAITAITTNGTSTQGTGTLADGYVTLDTLELNTITNSQGTMGAIALEGSNTYYIDAWILAVAPTQTSVVASYNATGTFYRVGTASTTALATGTRHRAETAGATSMEAYLAAAGNNVDLRVVGSAATEIDWAATVRYINVLADGIGQ